jgi:hypothetical protein
MGCEVTVHRLRYHDPVKVNGEALLAMRQSVGGARGDYVIDLMMNDLLEGLIAAEEALQEKDFGSLAKNTARVARQAGRLGLGELVNAAEAVANVVGDPTDKALAAVVGRLIRTGEATIGAVWQVLAIQARP